MIQRKAVEQRAKDDVPDIPKLQKGTTVLSWADSMIFFFSKVPSALGIATMSYVTIKESQVLIVAPVLAPYQPHLLEHGSVKDKYENCLLHSDVKFWNDNGTLFGYFKEVTCGNTFAYPIKTYEYPRNGHSACLALNF